MIDKARISELFEAAIELPANQRTIFLAEQCTDDPSALQELNLLIAADEKAQAEQFLDSSAIEIEAKRFQADENHRIGESFGSYRIVNLIAEGGMSEVYLAHDTKLNRRVAIKLTKSHLKTREVLRRFRSEQQILAHLQHAHIARLFEAGATADGLPFLVMEYVEGKPIDKFSDERELSIKERLITFRTVCSAVSYAHQNLIVHRDLKPSNILVTNDGEPKLLDFGIAKLLDASGSQAEDATATMLRVLTPEYASPEQVKGEPVTTATDVYSLGVILYELLTGRCPYRLKRKTVEEITKAICEQEPARPSSAVNGDWPAASSGRQATHDGQLTVERSRFGNRQLKGDLDNIILKALRKEPDRRYASVEQLSEDIRRHLEGLPVRARKGTFSYRASKFIQRNKIIASAGLVVLITLVAGIWSTAVSARKAHIERARAERRFNDVRNLVNSLLFQLDDEIEKLPGSTKARELLIKQTLDYLDRVASDASGDVPLQKEIATAYQKLGDVQSKLNGPNLGETKGALDSYRKALEIRQALYAASPRDVPTGLDLALALNRVGDILSKTNEAKGSLDYYRKSLELTERLASNKDPKARSALGYSYLLVARAQLVIDDLSGALENFSQSQAIREQLATENPNDDSLRQALISSYDGVAFVLSRNGKPAEALSYYRKSQELIEALAQSNPSNADYRRLVMDTYEWIGITMGALGQNAEGLNYHERALAISKSQIAADPANAQALDDIGDVNHEIGNTLTRLRRFKEAVESYHQAKTYYQALSDADPGDDDARRQVCLTMRETADALALLGDVRTALEQYRAALTIYQGLARSDPDDAETQYELAVIYENLAELLVRTGDLTNGIDNSQKALAIFEMSARRSPQNARVRSQLAGTYYHLGISEIKLAPSNSNSSGQRLIHLGAAKAWLEKALNTYEEMKKHETISIYDLHKPDEIAREIARCDAATSAF